jgi:hypothetical protein
MIAMRWATLLVTASLALVAAGAMASDLSPSALRVMVTAVVGLLAPLFWPGIGSTASRTVLRMAAWTAALVCAAAILLRVFGHSSQPAMADLKVCGMLWLILMAAHAAAAAIEPRLRGRPLDDDSARAMAGVAVAVALALLGSLPLWLGPAGELLSARHVGAIDTALGLSPLIHLAVAAANDLLRNDWFYQHSSLAGLPFSYPGLAATAWAYAAAGLLLSLAALAWRPPRRPVDLERRIQPPTKRFR